MVQVFLTGPYNNIKHKTWRFIAKHSLIIRFEDLNWNLSKSGQKCRECRVEANLNSWIPWCRKKNPLSCRNLLGILVMENSGDVDADIFSRLMDIPSKTAATLRNKSNKCWEIIENLHSFIFCIPSLLSLLPHFFSYRFHHMPDTNTLLIFKSHLRYSNKIHYKNW